MNENIEKSRRRLREEYKGDALYFFLALRSFNELMCQIESKKGQISI